MVVRIEKDTLGTITVSNNVLWGAQTQRALKYFKVSSEKIPWELIIALVQIKRAAAQVNYDLKLLSPIQMKAITQAADEVLSGIHTNEFPLSVWQTGSGTQSNMNVNEVLANIGNKFINKTNTNNTKIYIHPNDHVNKGQSSNDVFASAMHIAVIVALKELLIPTIKLLKNTLFKKSIKFRNIVKIGRTHLQDAIPLTLGQEISGWEYMLKKNIDQIKSTIPRLSELALGGTAVGTGFNTHPEYSQRVILALSNLIKHSFICSTNRFESLATCDAIVYSHSTLKGLAISMTKIANDIRLLSSGPRCGLGELKIPENEPGSSIMPGKINPTQCESMTMLCYQVIGNDVTIGMGGASGHLELNVYRPLIIYNFLQSIHLLTDGIKNFNDYCILNMEPQLEKIKEFLNKSLMLATALNAHIGYDKSAHIARNAHLKNLTLKQSAIELGYITEEQFDNWVKPKNMIYPHDN